MVSERLIEKIQETGMHLSHRGKKLPDGIVAPRQGCA